MIEEKDSRVKKAIEAYQEEQLLRAAIGLGGFDKHLMCDQLVEEQLLIDAENFENFLHPKQIKSLMENNLSELRSAYQGGKKTSIWKPEQYDYPPHVKDLLLGLKPKAKHVSAGNKLVM